MSMRCPCGSSNARGQAVALEACCGRYLDGGEAAPDAERLMRSRYSAFVLERPAYLCSTWHPSTRPAECLLEPGVKWLGLAIKEHHVVDEDHAEVAFVARSRVGGRAQRLQERSRFVFEAGCWWYVDGDLS